MLQQTVDQRSVILVMTKQVDRAARPGGVAFTDNYCLQIMKHFRW